MSLPNPYYEDGSVTIYHGDCREILPHLPKVDLVVTSPPYYEQRDYLGCQCEAWRDVVPPALSSIPDCGATQVLVNLGVVHRDGELVEYWDALKAEMKSAGWRFFGQYVWDQGSGLPGVFHGRFAPSYEFVFHFNRHPVEVLKWVPTTCRKRKHPGDLGTRDRTGRVRTVTSPETFGGPTKIPDNVIRLHRRLNRGVLEDEHPATFSETLPAFLIRSFPCATVLDPFLGSGTTLVAAKDLGRKAIGIEIEERYCEIAAKRCRQEVLTLTPIEPATVESETERLAL